MLGTEWGIKPQLCAVIQVAELNPASQKYPTDEKQDYHHGVWLTGNVHSHRKYTKAVTSKWIHQRASMAGLMTSIPKADTQMCVTLTLISVTSTPSA